MNEGVGRNERECVYVCAGVRDAVCARVYVKKKEKKIECCLCRRKDCKTEERDGNNEGRVEGGGKETLQ